DYYRIGKDFESPSSWLLFQVPGLSRIVFSPKQKQSPWKYQTANPCDVRHDYDGDLIHIEPSLSFSDSQYGWVDDLDYTLGCAQAELLKYQKYVEEYEVQKQEIAKDKEQREATAQAREARDATSAAVREAEVAEKQ